MEKSITLYPKYIEANVGMDEIVGNGSKAGGEGYRTVHPNETMQLGTVAFNSIPMHGLSAACILKKFDITFNQRCGINVVSGRELYWTFYPRYIFNINLGGFLDNKGLRLLSFDAQSLNNSGVQSKSNGGKYFDNDRTRTLFDGSYSNVFGDSNKQLGFYLTASNPASSNYKLYLTNLTASVTYEAKYYARFYDEDGTTLKKTETVAGGNRATPPSLSRTGHSVTWQQVGTNNTYSASSLPTSQDTDIAFKAVYTPDPKTVRIKETASGSCEVFKFVNGSWQKQNYSSYNSSGKYYEYSFRYGDGVSVEAKGCNQPSEDLVVKVYNTDNGSLISEQTIVPGIDRSTGITGTEAGVYSAFALTENIRIEVTPQTHYFTITTQTSSGGGSLTATHRVARHASSSVTVTPNIGYYITGITKDGSSVTPAAGGTKTVVSFTNVTEDHSVSAVFSRIQFNITLNLPTGVTATADGTTVSGGTVPVYYGDTVALAFSCGSGLSLTGAFLDGSADSLMEEVIRQKQEFSFTLYSVTGNHSLTVTATDNLITIVEGSHEGGEIEGEFGTFLRGKITLQYTAIEDGIHHFDGWTGIDKTGTTFTIEDTDTASSYTIGATFVTYECVIQTQIIKLSLELEDVGFVEPANVSANSGDTVTFIYTAPEGGFLNNQGAIWFEDQELQFTKLDAQHYQFSIANISSGGRVFIYAEARGFTFTSNVKSPDGDNVGGIVFVYEPSELDPSYPSYEHNQRFNSEFPLTAQPSDGYRFVSWSDGVINSERTILMPPHKYQIDALFRRLEHIVSLNVHEGGSAIIESENNERSDGLSVRQWENVRLTVTTELGQKLKDVLLDGVSVFDEVTLTRRGGTWLLTNVTAAHTIEVIFEPRIYTNHRKLIDYYPPVIASIAEIQRLMAAYQISVDAMWDAISFLEENQYIETATDEGVRMWEKELGIIPAATDTLNQRKARLRLKWVPSNNFTTKWLHGWLEDVCGTEVQWPELEGYTLHVTLPWFASWWTIFSDLKQYT